MKCFIDIDSKAGRCFDERSADRFGKLLCLECRHLSLRFEIALVRHNDERHVLDARVFDARYLLGKLVAVVKRRTIRDIEYQHETLTSSHILITHC